MRKILTSFLLLSLSFVWAQEATFRGKISIKGKPEAHATVVIQKNDFKKGSVTTSTGDFELQIPAGDYNVTISSVGLKTISEKITLQAHQEKVRNYEMQEDILGLDQVVITGTAHAFPQFTTPVVVSKISGRVFETTQSLSLSEGLNFTPGLRTETNCQNCGFNSLRINGLEGAYSQILINGRPVFSALAGVYGLEMIPTNMINHVEVIRGSGSALYGGNAIGGTVNILTKDPIQNAFAVGNNLSLYQGKTPDNTLFANASIVDEKFSKGLTLFAYQRNRKPYDANADEYSEITQLKNTTFGMDMFWNTSERSKLKLNLNTIKEFRRGGNKFDLLAHESDITEQLEHDIFGGDMSFEHFSQDFAHKFAYYLSIQNTDRKSYYGGGLGYHLDGIDAYNELDKDNLADTDPDNDTQERDLYFNALNAYGSSKGIVGVGGVQYNYNIDEKWNLALGTEYKSDKVEDIGNGRTIDQKVKTFGSYTQLEWRPVDEFTLLLGSRFDYVHINGKYSYRNEKMNIDQSLSKFVPRITAMYSLDDQWKFRTTYAQGYRAPQAFDEDLHTEVVGGDVVFVELDKNLKPESSDSFTASINYTQKEGKTQMNFILEGFLTKINHSFTDELVSETDIIRRIKKNAHGNLLVKGINAEANIAFEEKIIWQSGLTLQNAKFSEKQIHFEDTNPIEIQEVLKTPNTYAYTTLTYSPNTHWKLSYSGVYTGKMNVLHSTKEALVKTPSFFEQNIRVAYTLGLNDYKLEFSTGIQNLFNSYQKDFDKGADRDATYIYGPQRPRTFFMGVTCKLN